MGDTYISREYVLKCMEDSYKSAGISAEAKGKMTRWLNKAPAADVRPVVFCKDCKWYQIDELKKDGTEDRRYKPSVCVLAEQRRDPNHFCADGEKKEES